jgi:para-nitrobenzyl esterase
MNDRAAARTVDAERSADRLVVAVDGGLVAGRREPGGVRAWLGVPYAAPPTGALRWRPPAPVPAWRGVRPTQALAPQSLQPDRPADSVYAEFAGRQASSEDCLYLNVWSAAPPGERWPVMVWIHGGAFQQGSGANPVFVRGDLARQGVVLVTFNYRLGPFGFMAHPALSAESVDGASGNYGLLDMAAALAWVNRNITAFGGDPQRVTLFGQSAGAAGVIDLMATTRTRGLFARAIAQSFGVTPMATLAEAEQSGLAIAERVGAQGLDALRALSGETLLARYLEHGERWMPIVDGGFIERPVIETFATQREQRVPLLIGWNRDEGTTFPAVADVAALRGRLASRFGPHARAAEAFYPLASDAEARASSLALFGDELFAWGVWRAACDHARGAPTWLYHFAHAQPFADDQTYREAARAADLGVFHSSEYPYIFGTTSVLTRAWGEADRRVTELMQATWLRFAKTGRPDGGGLPEWPIFADGRATVMRLAPEPGLVDVPRREHLEFVDRATP